MCISLNKKPRLTVKPIEAFVVVVVGASAAVTTSINVHFAHF